MRSSCIIGTLVSAAESMRLPVSGVESLTRNLAHIYLIIGMIDEMTGTDGDIGDRSCLRVRFMIRSLGVGSILTGSGLYTGVYRVSNLVIHWSIRGYTFSHGQSVARTSLCPRSHFVVTFLRISQLGVVHSVPSILSDRVIPYFRASDGMSLSSPAI